MSDQPAQETRRSRQDHGRVHRGGEPLQERQVHGVRFGLERVPPHRQSIRLWEELDRPAEPLPDARLLGQAAIQLDQVPEEVELGQLPLIQRGRGWRGAQESGAAAERVREDSIDRAPDGIGSWSRGAFQDLRIRGLRRLGHGTRAELQARPGYDSEVLEEAAVGTRISIGVERQVRHARTAIPNGQLEDRLDRRSHSLADLLVTRLRRVTVVDEVAFTEAASEIDGVHERGRARQGGEYVPVGFGDPIGSGVRFARSVQQTPGFVLLAARPSHQRPVEAGNRAHRVVIDRMRSRSCSAASNSSRSARRTAALFIAIQPSSSSGCRVMTSV